jgi:chromosome segregation ATPase
MSLANPEFIKSPVGIQVDKLIETHTSLKENATKLAAEETKVTTAKETIARLNLELEALNIKTTALGNTKDFLTDLNTIFTVDEDEIDENNKAIAGNDRERHLDEEARTDKNKEIDKANAEIATLNTNSNTALGELETAVKNLATHMTTIKTATSTLNNILHKADNTARIAEFDTVIAEANAKLDAVGTGLKAQLAKAENDKVEADNALNNFVAVDLAAYKASIKAEGNSKVSAITKKIEAADDVFDEETSGAATAEKKECMKLYAAKMKEADNKYAEEKAALENASAAFDAPIAALEKEITDTESFVTKSEVEKTALTTAGGDVNDAIDNFKDAVAKYNSYDMDKIVTPRFVKLLDDTAGPKGPEVNEDIKNAFDLAKKAVENTKKVIGATDTNLQAKILERDAKAEALEQAQKEYNTYLSSADGLSHQQAVDDYELLKATKPRTRAEKAEKKTKRLEMEAAKKVMSDKKEPVDKAQEELEILEPQVQATTKDLDDLKGQLPDLETKLTNTKTALEEEKINVDAEKVVFDALPKVDVDALLAKEKAEAVKVMENFAKLLSFDATEKFAGEDLSVAENAENAENAVLGEAIAVFEFDFGSHA